MQQQRHDHHHHHHSIQKPITYKRKAAKKANPYTERMGAGSQGGAGVLGDREGLDAALCFLRDTQAMYDKWPCQAVQVSAGLCVKLGVYVCLQTCLAHYPATHCSGHSRHTHGMHHHSAGPNKNSAPTAAPGCTLYTSYALLGAITPRGAMPPPCHPHAAHTLHTLPASHHLTHLMPLPTTSRPPSTTVGMRAPPQPTCPTMPWLGGSMGCGG